MATRHEASPPGSQEVGHYTADLVEENAAGVVEGHGRGIGIEDEGGVWPTGAKGVR